MISVLVSITGPPTVHTLSQQDIIEGSQLSITCQATPGDPSFSTFYWTKADNPGFRQNRSTLQLPNIQRNSSGIYRCTAENNYHNGEKGSDSRTMVVNVLCRSLIMVFHTQSCKYFVYVFSISLTRFLSNNMFSVSGWFLFFCDQLSIIT